MFLQFVATLVSPTSTYFSCALCNIMLSSCRSYAKHNDPHTSFFDLFFENSQQPSQRRAADSLFFAFTDRYNQQAGMSLQSQTSGNLWMTAVLRVPSNCFAQRQSSSKVHLPCPLSTWPMIDSSMFPNSTCSTLAILIVFSRLPSSASCVVTATGCDFMEILRQVFAGIAVVDVMPPPVLMSHRIFDLHSCFRVRD